MATRLGRSSEKIFAQLSKLQGPDRSLKTVRNLVAADGSRESEALSRRSQQLMNRIIDALKTSLPGIEPEIVGGFAANLLDLWETGQKLDRKLKELTKLRSPRGRQRLRDTLLWIDAIQIDMGSYWIREIQKVLPKLLECLNRHERNQGRVGRSKNNPAKFPHK
jgi:hypothetical protein